jgi:hypothetical protein
MRILIDKQSTCYIIQQRKLQAPSKPNSPDPRTLRNQQSLSESLSHWIMHLETRIILAILGTISPWGAMGQQPYDLAALPINERQMICGKNIAFCLNACNQLVSENTCSMHTMAFTCTCTNGQSPVDIHYFPIQAQQCIGENQDCRNACSSSFPISDNVSVCSNLCDQKFVCGTPNAAEEKIFKDAVFPIAPIASVSVIDPVATSSSSPLSSSSSSSSAILASTSTFVPRIVPVASISTTSTTYVAFPTAKGTSSTAATSASASATATNGTGGGNTFNLNGSSSVKISSVVFSIGLALVLLMLIQ